MGIQTEISRIESAKSNLKIAIEGKGVTVPDGTKLDGYAALVDQVVQGGEPVIQPLDITANVTYTAPDGVDGYSPVTVNVSGGEVPVPTSPKEVNFYDYEGTLLYAYTLEEAKNLSELPQAPKHEGLLFQEWNWTLEDIKALTRPMSIGATYITDDGKTRLYITVPANSMPDRPPPRNQVPLYIQQTVANGVTIDWGDGTAPETLPRTGAVNTTHTYEQAGDYVISLDPAEGCTLGFGNGSTSYCVMGSTNKNGRVYCNMLQKVYIGNNVSSIGNYGFYNCYSLASITIPNNVTSIDDGAFRYCYSLASITIPDGVTSIGNSAFYYCDALASITIPDSVTSIDDGAFQYCYGMKECHFLSPTPPTLGGTRVLSNLSSDCVIYVPVGSAEAYKTATNWTVVANKIQEEPA